MNAQVVQANEFSTLSYIIRFLTVVYNTKTDIFLRLLYNKKRLIAKKLNIVLVSFVSTD